MADQTAVRVLPIEREVAVLPDGRRLIALSIELWPDGFEFRYSFFPAPPPTDEPLLHPGSPESVSESSPFRIRWTVTDERGTAYEALEGQFGGGSMDRIIHTDMWRFRPRPVDRTLCFRCWDGLGRELGSVTVTVRR